MINKIIKAISIIINQTFNVNGANYLIYANDVEQDLNPPAFIIQIIQPSKTPYLKSRYLKVNPFDIIYIPAVADEGNNLHLHDVAEKLMECLDFITLLDNDILHGTNMRYEIVDDVLHFFVNYNHFMIDDKQEDSMKDVETDIGVIEGE